MEGGEEEGTVVGGGGGRATSVWGPCVARRLGPAAPPCLSLPPLIKAVDRVTPMRACRSALVVAGAPPILPHKSLTSSLVATLPALVPESGAARRNVGTTRLASGRRGPITRAGGGAQCRIALWLSDGASATEVAESGA